MQRQEVFITQHVDISVGVRKIIDVNPFIGELFGGSDRRDWRRWRWGWRDSQALSSGLELITFVAGLTLKTVFVGETIVHVDDTIAPEEMESRGALNASFAIKFEAALGPNPAHEQKEESCLTEETH